MEKIKKLICLFLLTSISVLSFEDHINVSSKAYGTIAQHPKIVDLKLETSEDLYYTEISLYTRFEVSKIKMNVSPNIGKIVVYDKERPDKQYITELTGKEDEISIPLKDVEFKTVCIKWVPSQSNGKILNIKEVYIYIKRITPVTPIDSFTVSPAS